MRIKAITIKVTTTGGAGAAVGDAIRPIPGGVGRLISYSVKYASQPVTCDVTITAEEPTGATKTLATIADANIDLEQRQPLEAAVDGVGADVADSTKSPNLVSPIVIGSIKVAVTQGDAAVDAVTVVALLEI